MAGWFRRNKAQTVLEYATVISCAVAALITMQVYIKRAYQGKLKQTADQFGAQYAPRRTTGSYVTNFTTDTVTQTKVLTEIDLNYDLDGDGELESDSTATRSITGLGTYVDDGGGDGIVMPWELIGGSVSTKVGNETVGEIRADEGLFDE